MTTPMTRVYRNGVLDAQGFALAEISEFLKDPQAIVWVDFCAPTESQLQTLAEELGLHHLAVEDAIGRHQRPKLDRYPSHLFLSCHSVKVDTNTGTLQVDEIDAFINDRWIVTVRKDEGFSMSPILERWDLSPELAVHGTSFLLYGILDVVVDTYFDAIDTFDQYYDQVSNQIFADKPLHPSQQRDWFDMRRSMVHLHRIVIPLREAIGSLLIREHNPDSEEMYPYFQDVYDHILRISETSDSLRDLVGSIMETNLVLREYRQNHVMKKVSSWAAIIAVPTLITGFYGMNVPYPGFGDAWGVFAASGLIIVTCVGLYRLFRRVDWL